MDTAKRIAVTAVLGVAFAFLVYAILSSQLILIAFFAVVGVAISFMVPRRYLMSMALWVFVLVPVGYMDVSRLYGRLFTPALILMFLWMLRTFLAQRSSKLDRPTVRGVVIMALIVATLIVTLLFSTSVSASALWVAVFLIAAILPTIAGQLSTDDIWPTLRATLAWIGIFLFALALLDFLFAFNPWASLFKYAISDKSWSVFRTRTSLGHPLISSVVASVSLAACFFPGPNRRRLFYLVGIAASVGVIVLAVSRSGVIAAGLGIGFGVLTKLLSRNARQRARGLVGLVVGGIALAVLAFSPLLNARNESSGGVGSVDYRTDVFGDAVSVWLSSPIVGVGPGQSVQVIADKFGQNLESSALQLLVSVGVLGCLPIVIGLIALGWRALRLGRAGALAALVSFVVGISGFSAIDAIPALLILMTPVIFVIMSPKTIADEDRVEPVDSSAANLRSTTVDGSALTHSSR